MVDATMLAKVLPINTTLNNLSGRASIWLTRIACLFCFFTRYRNLYRFIDIMPISEPEKKADNIIKKINRISSVERGYST
ncbi:hypothetical protein TUM19329_32690 [Legionella antarctica]|uniref:Uncharacterized protein n=1 Tax=Legionella antarctica TaxID=2708020 RepID=A0A6F8T975_9GAMM|nr:hypothetical protein TUM19329_32690 [Legionella antarctica]